MSERTDKEIIQSYLAGNESIFQELVLKYLPSLVNFLNALVKNRQEAEDLSQVVWIKVWKKIKSFDQESNFKTWLLVVGRNTALDYLRKQKVKSLSLWNDEFDNESEIEISDPAPLPDELLMSQELQEEVEGVLNTLKVKSRIVLELYYYEGLTLDEISKVLDESLNTTKSRYRRALLELRKSLKI